MTASQSARSAVSTRAARAPTVQTRTNTFTMIDAAQWDTDDGHTWDDHPRSHIPPGLPPRPSDNHLFTMVSLAEQALREATGQTYPIECFGCAGIERFKDNVNHLFKDCPNRHDSEVQENFKRNLAAFRERQAQRRAGNNWKRQGYPNKAMATTIQRIAHPATSAVDRQALIAALPTFLAKAPPPTPAPTPAPAAPGPRQMGFEFLTFPQERATAQTPGNTFFGSDQQPYRFHLTPKLPFLKLPIGTGESSQHTATLAGLLDSGGCCNMGWLSYHEAIRQHHPQFVAKWTNLTESNYQTFSIGGLNGGVEITHIVKYWLPYDDKGTTPVVAIGLSADMPLNTLYGLPFTQNAQCVVDFDRMQVDTKYFKTQWALEMRTPRRSPPEDTKYDPTHEHHKSFSTDVILNQTWPHEF